LEGFEAGNPEGFAEPRSIAFDRVAATARIGSLFGKVLDVDELVVQRPALTIEFQGLKSNVGAFMDRLDREKTEDTDGRRFRVRRLRVEGATVRFRSDALSGSPREVTLPTIELNNIGTSDDAATTSELIAAVLRALTAEGMKAAEGLVPSDLLNSLGGELKLSAETIRRKVEDELDRLKVPKP
ncbi:MAG TPA: hypothetical protein VF950_12370, partial [Planctomycetota bacterium]